MKTTIHGTFWRKLFFLFSFDGKFVSSLFSYMCINAYTCKQYYKHTDEFISANAPPGPKLTGTSVRAWNADRKGEYTVKAKSPFSEPTAVWLEFLVLCWPLRCEAWYVQQLVSFQFRMMNFWTTWQKLMQLFWLTL